MIRTMSVLFLTSILFIGCATNEGPEYDGKNYNQIKRYEIGTVIAERPVVISDNGSGKFLGALIGAVLGSTIGSGKFLGALIGAVLG